MWRLSLKSPEGQTVLESSVHLRFLVWRFKRLAFGPGRVFPRSQEKKDHDLWSHMAREVMRNGPGYTSTKASWSHEWWEMVPTSIWMSIPSHRFIDPVDRSRSISIHPQRIMVDRRWWIEIRDHFVVDFIDHTCVILGIEMCKCVYWDTHYQFSIKTLLSIWVLHTCRRWNRPQNYVGF